MIERGSFSLSGRTETDRSHATAACAILRPSPLGESHAPEQSDPRPRRRVPRRPRPVAHGAQSRPGPRRSRDHEAPAIVVSPGTEAARRDRERLVHDPPAARIAPWHTALFVKTAKAGGYDATTFHRIVAGGIIQGGDPLVEGPRQGVAVRYRRPRHPEGRDLGSALRARDGRRGTEGVEPRTARGSSSSSVSATSRRSTVSTRSSARSSRAWTSSTRSARRRSRARRRRSASR